MAVSTEEQLTAKNFYDSAVLFCKKAESLRNAARLDPSNWTFKRDVRRSGYFARLPGRRLGIWQVHRRCIYLHDKQCPLAELMERIYAIRIDEVLLEKPFLALALADTLEEVESNAMEDTDPFPYDLPDDEILLEVKRSLGLEEYPNKSYPLTVDQSV